MFDYATVSSALHDILTEDPERTNNNTCRYVGDNGPHCPIGVLFARLDLPLDWVHVEIDGLRLNGTPVENLPHHLLHDIPAEAVDLLRRVQDHADQNFPWGRIAHEVGL